MKGILQAAIGIIEAHKELSIQQEKIIKYVKKL